MGAAILAGYAAARRQAWRFGISRDEFDRYAFWLVISAFLSARAYFVLFDWQYYARNPAEIMQIWRGGLSIYGAILGGVLFAYLFVRRKAYSVWQLLDLTALALPLGQALGRLGNFINYEAFGPPTSLPWRMFVPQANRPPAFINTEFFQPVFLYEALGSLLIFAILFRQRGMRRPGALVLQYLVLYAVLRFMMEFIRLDSVIVGGWRADQVVSVIIFSAAVALFWVRQTRVQKT
jgi:phosphatidylglycerol:prolipoprotein diacylglycerol transferase